MLVEPFRKDIVVPRLNCLLLLIMFGSSQLLLPLKSKILSGAFSFCDAPNESVPAVHTPAKWDNNWDLRDNKGSKAIRQIVLIRHGQYVQGEKGDVSKVLTPLGTDHWNVYIFDKLLNYVLHITLGREQATKTGKRLRELLDGRILFPVRSVHYSTMARATETYNLIRPELPPIEDHQCQPCSMIREGAVCRPVPPSSQWSPSEETFVKNGLQVSAFLLRTSIGIPISLTQLMIFLQVEAAFRNYVYRAGPKDVLVSEASDMKSSLSGVCENEKKEPDPDNLNGNFSDIYVCHGMYLSS